MNNDYCDTRTTFGQTIEGQTPVMITILATGKTLEAKTSGRVRSDATYGNFLLEGLTQANTLQARDIKVEVIEPPIEPGFYLNSRGVVLKITGEPDKRPSIYHLSHIGTTNLSYKGPCLEREYYSSIRKGNTVRIADIKGQSVHA